MENYESLGTIGEGTYGVVLKCRHKVTGQIVAIKRFKESDDDEQVKKTALREIKVLKQLRHENIVSLLEVFRVKGKLYLVFEFVEKTILEEIEKYPEGLEPAAIKRLMWQLVRAIHFCHQHNIIHRDIKPENLLVSRNGVLKLCDFGFARPLAGAGAKYTEYVSTRWYRAPELLVGDVSYGKAVDVWSIGCMFAEIATGLPLFPGDSDIDQLYHIIKCLGQVTPRHQELFRKNALYVGVKLPRSTEREPLAARFPQFDKYSVDFLTQTITEEPLDRWTCAELLKHPFFDGVAETFEQELQEAIQRDLNDTMALRKKRARNQKPPSSRGSGGGGFSTMEVSPALAAVTTTDHRMQTPDKWMTSSSLKPVTSTSTLKDKHGDGTSHSMQSMCKKGVGTGQVRTSSPKNVGNCNNTGAVVLPTLTSSMTPSSSSTSTVSTSSVVSTTDRNHPAPHHHQQQHHQQPQQQQQQQQQCPPSRGGGLAVPPSRGTRKPAGQQLPNDQQGGSSEHIDAMHHHLPPRISMTSHGGRPSLQYQFNHPQQVSVSSFQSFAQQPRPPPSSYGRNPYACTSMGNGTPKSKQRSRDKSNATGLRSPSKKPPSSLQSSMDIYSPTKKGSTSQFSSNSNSNSSSSSNSNSNSNGSGRQASTIAPLPSGFDAVPASHLRGYAPPKTSHGGMRGASKHRRGHDPRSYN